MWTLLIALMLAGPTQATAVESDRRTDTNAVYSALMYVAPGNRDSANPVYLIEATTFVPVVVTMPGFSLERCVTVPPRYAASWAEILTEVEARNIAPGTLEPTLKLSKPYMLLSADQVADFRSGFPRTSEPGSANPKFKGATDLFRLSVVYFNKNRTLALMYNTRSCGMLCGTGSWAVFEKLNRPDGQSEWIKQADWVHCFVEA